MTISIYDPHKPPSEKQQHDIVSFLYTHLGQYGDPVSAITKAINYALNPNPGFGGCIFVAEKGEEIIGVVIINETGMEEYIPENILVYIASHRAKRGEGIGKALMEAVNKHCKGSIALHVEPDNPAIHLYEKYGFTSKYLEMRLTR